MIKIILLLISSILFMINIGCSPVGILAGGSSATMVVAEGDRTLGTVVDDATIKLNLSAKFLKSENTLFLDINSNVTEGRVLLTGLVDTQEIRIDAVRKVWEIDGVREVINEIEVGNKTTLKEYVNDLWINTQAKSLAAKTIGFRSFSYNFETIKGKVYIAGITSRPEQLEAIVESTKTIKGVIEIVNYVVIKE